ncbi:hypothetical protein ScPMuIL_018971 [Solemya velum]
MNMVTELYHDASIGNAVDLVIVRIILLDEDQEELKITHHADKTLYSFCKWQKNMNFKDDDHPNHHDVAILLTRHNICSQMNEPCGTLGLAQVAGMCQPHRSCNINEDTGLALAYTIAHELGHNFGMKHDNEHNKCMNLSVSSNQQYVMAPHLSSYLGPLKWSKCSMRDITKFLDRDWGYCLDDEPADHDFVYPVLPPGTMYDADHQCRLQYGQDAALCDGIEDVCATLWCRVDNKCSTKLEPAAEGTICGSNKWCFVGKCVEIGERPEAINGAWGEWSEWTDCTRTCGAGVLHSARHCDNPAPENGGKYCIGERKRYRICNTDPCEEITPSFRQIQCSEFNLVPYKKKLFEWEPVPTPKSPCQLHCKPKNKFFSVLLKDTVTDGTSCTPGRRNMCISGRCRHVGCDWLIDSPAKEDRCGVCHGDGSTCKTIKDQYTETQGLGYVEATIIPSGARNIRVEEVAAANNYLALRNDNGVYYLNGHWFIQWSGDYELAGTVVHYRRDSNKESFNAIGPLKEPLHIMLLLQAHNPGVEFEYTVPNSNSSHNNIPQEFKWEFAGWTHCTESCGGGTQRSAVLCMEREAGNVDDRYCNITTKPDDIQKSCNIHLCPAKWWFGPWQHCSVTCGESGRHRRTVICVRSLGSDEQVALDDEACTDQEKPMEEEACHHKDPCPGNSKWLVGEWSSCNGNPCATQYRDVWCQSPIIGCESLEKPAATHSCGNITCGTWTTEEWSECTRSCGQGIQYRKITCVGGKMCNIDTEPSSEQECLLDGCPTTPVPPTSEPPTSIIPQLLQTTLNGTDDFGTETGTNSISNSTEQELQSTNTPENSILQGEASATAVKSDVDLSREITPESTEVIADQVNLSTETLPEGGVTASEDLNFNIGLDGPKVAEDSKEDDIELGSNEILINQDNILEPEKKSEQDTTNLVEGSTHKHRHHHQHRNQKHQHKNTETVTEMLETTPMAEISATIGSVADVPDISLIREGGTEFHEDEVEGSIAPDDGNIMQNGNGEDHEAQNLTNSQSLDTPLQEIMSPNLQWQSSQWTECSQRCGDGIQTRSVTCINRVRLTQVEESECDIASKPTAVQTCIVTQCLQWQMSAWTECSASCGFAVRRRQVQCPETDMCLLEEKPADTENCNLPHCLAWVHGQWSQCSLTCDGGQQVRLVQCVNLTSQQIATDCVDDIRPSEIQKCNEQNCPNDTGALSVTCESNEMSYMVCRALRRMKQCNKRFVKLKCCKTCGMDSRNLYRPHSKLLR